MEKVLISACLLGDKCRCDGNDNAINELEELSSYFELVPFCPEVEGGLPTPRLPSEIKRSQVKNSKGEDVTAYFYKGAEKAFNICSYLGIKLAILKENSPSCGVHKIHNGWFNGNLIDGEGITTSFLRRKGIKVINETEAIELLKSIKENEAERLKASIEKRKEDEEGKMERKPFDANENFSKRINKERHFDDERKPFRKDDGFRKDGYRKEGFKKDRFGDDSFKKDGFKKDGFRRSSFRKDGYKDDSFKKDGFKKRSFRKGDAQEENKEFRKDRPSYKKDGYPKKDGFKKTGFRKDGFKQDGPRDSSFKKGGYKGSSFRKDGFKGKEGYSRSSSRGGFRGNKKSYERKATSKVNGNGNESK